MARPLNAIAGNVGVMLPTVRLGMIVHCIPSVALPYGEQVGSQRSSRLLDRTVSSVWERVSIFAVHQTAIYSASGLAGKPTKKVRKDIMKKAAKKERAAETQHLTGTIERLRRQKLEAENLYFEAGADAGREWAVNASYPDLMFVLRISHIIEATDSLGILAELASSERLGDYFSDRFRADHLLVPLAADWGITDGFTEAWIKGWLGSVQFFWDEVWAADGGVNLLQSGI